MPLDVVIERGTKRTFASALAWPGWSRSGRDEDAALEALELYRPRYAATIGRAAPRGALTVVQRVRGDATTDFGAPSVAADVEHEPSKPAELKRHLDLLDDCWRSFDRTLKRYDGVALALGPRGGGRQPAQIESHVFGAAKAYLSGVGGAPRDAGSDLETLRAAEKAALRARARGEEPPPNPRRTKPLWPPRYAIRRSAWHILDHVWEIEDRAPR